MALKKGARYANHNMVLHMAVAVGAFASVASAEALYRCADGTFTNREDRNCSPYESKAIGQIHSSGARMTESAKPSVAEVKPYVGFERNAVRPHSGH